jgi:hypothetical protein
MIPPTDCYLRLFDVDKYREIQLAGIQRDKKSF